MKFMIGYSKGNRKLQNGVLICFWVVDLDVVLLLHFAAGGENETLFAL